MAAMNTLHSLSRRFREARLEVEVTDAPLGARVPRRAMAEIVQLDIARPPRAPSERFLVYPGAEDNRLDVLGIDAPRRQLVLFVQEARRAFEVTVSRQVKLPAGTRVLEETKTHRTIEQVTGGEKRHFLCGMDEQHLFIAELPYGVSSVHGAREALRAPEVPPNLKSRAGRTVRQGEWFFMPTTARDRAEIEAAVRAGATQRSIGIAQAARISRAGRPHVADEVVVLRDGNSARVPRIFVRGDVRHPDHRTVTLREFHRTVPNRERFAQPVGVLWID
jgi:hypothetical protein